MTSLRRSAWVIWSIAALAIAGAFVVLALHAQAERERGRNAAAAALRGFVQGAEAALNRGLLGVDVVLAGLGEVVVPRPGSTASGLDTPVVAALRRETDQNLMLRDLALVEASGQLLAAARDATLRLGLELPDGFVSTVLAEPYPTLVISPPATGRATGEEVVYLARPLRLSDGRSVAALAEVPVALLANLVGPGIPERYQISLETPGGMRLFVLPRGGMRDAAPTGGVESAGAQGRSLRAPSRLTGEPALVVARPTLYPGALVTVSLPLAAIDAGVQGELLGDGFVAGGFAVVVVALAAMLHLHLARLARARREMEAARERLGRTNDALNEEVRMRAETLAALAHTQREVDQILATTDEGYWRIDNDLVTVDVNPAMCTMLGRPRAEIIGKHILTLVGAAEAEIFRREIAGRHRGVTGRYEISLQRPDGAQIECVFHATPVYDGDGERVGFAGLWTEVGTFKAAQREAQQASATLDRALDAMAEGFVLYDAQQRVVRWNRRFLEIFPWLVPVLRPGAALAELQRAAAQHVLPGADEAERTAWSAAREAAATDGADEQRLPDGRVIESVQRPTPDGGSVGVHRDVTESRAAARELARAKAALDQALDAMSDGFVVFDADRRLLLWNRRYVEMFPYLDGAIAPGMTDDEVGRIAAAALLPGADEAAREAFVARRRALRDEGSGTDEFTMPDGAVLHIVDRRTEEGHTVSVFRDVSEAHAAARALEEARDAAEAAARAKARFLASMSHEIRTPLNAVLGMNGLLRNTGLSDEQRRYVDLIARSGEALLTVINDILDLSRLEAGRLTLEVVEFSPGGAVHDVVSMLGPRAQAKGLSLVTYIPADLPSSVRGDPSRLRQVLFNLIGNAVKFTERGSVTVELGHAMRGDGRIGLTVAVQDTGIGIADDVLPQLFEHFTQADSSTARRYGGSGLGLAISREIVRVMGGEISVTSRLGEGSRFVFRVPFEAVLDSAFGPFVGGDEPASDGAESPGGLRILAAEDNSVNQVLIRAMLAGLGHYLDVVSDGIEVVRQVQAAPYDLVLMDVQMPNMDGIEATRAIRALPDPVARVPILAMTANVLAEERAAYLAAGMDGVVPKPIDRAQLREAIEVAQGSRTSTAAETARG